MVRVSYSLIDIGLYTCIGITVQLGISDLLAVGGKSIRNCGVIHTLSNLINGTCDRVMCFIKDINILLLAELKTEHP